MLKISDPTLGPFAKIFARPNYQSLLLAVPFLVLLIWVMASEWTQYQDEVATVKQNEYRAATVYADRINTRLATQFNELEFIAVALLEKEPHLNPPSPATIAALHRFMNIHRAFYVLNIQSADGRQILWSTQTQSATPLAAPETFTPLTNQPNFLLGTSKFAQRFNGYFIAMRYRATDAQGQTQFFVGSPFRLSELMAFDIHDTPWIFTLRDNRTGLVMGQWQQGKVTLDQTIAAVKADAQKIPVGHLPLSIEVQCQDSLGWSNYINNGRQRWVLELSLLVLLAAISIVSLNLLRARDQANRRLMLSGAFNRMIAEINQVIATCDDETQLLQQLCALGALHGKLDLVWIGHPDDTGEFQFLAAAGKTDFLTGLTLSINPDTPSGQGFCAQTWREGRVIYSTDPKFSPFPAPWQTRADQFGLKALASLPIQRNGELWAILAIYHHDPVAFLALSTWFEELANDVSRGLSHIDLLQREHHHLALNRAILDNSSGGIMLLKNRTIQFANQRLADMIGAPTAQALIGTKTRDYYLNPADQAYLLTLIPTAFAKGEQVRFEAQFKRIDNNEIRWFSLVGQPFNQPGFDETWVVTDITQYHHALSQQQLLASALAAVQEDVAITNATQKIVYINAAFTAHTGFTAADMRGRTLESLIHAQTPKTTLMRLKEAFDDGLVFQGELAINRKSGGEFWGLLTINPVRDANHKITHFVSILRDITAIRQLNERLEYQSLHDPLTHLPNRRALERELAQRINLANRTQTPLVVGMLDLDDFKPVNDTWGHEAGDILLRSLAERLTMRLREHDFLARIGGDEFVIVISHLEAHHFGDQLVRVLDRLHQAVETPFNFADGQQSSVGMSMGIAIYPQDAADGDALMRQADAALYQTKTHKKDRTVWWRHGVKTATPLEDLTLK
ncbi:MAG TPA: diguanylate cyclase [Halothiobacillus sp.]|nr:diguanylate cyclase [Halothiobacillus sp.]